MLNKQRCVHAVIIVPKNLGHHPVIMQFYPGQGGSNTKGPGEQCFNSARWHMSKPWEGGIKNSCCQGCKLSFVYRRSFCMALLLQSSFAELNVAVKSLHV